MSGSQDWHNYGGPTCTHEECAKREATVLSAMFPDDTFDVITRDKPTKERPNPRQFLHTVTREIRFNVHSFRNDDTGAAG